MQATGSAAIVAPASHKKFYHHLYFQVLCAIVLGVLVTVHVPAGRMQPIDSPMIFKGLAWRGGLPSDGVCDSLGTWNPKTNLT